MSDNSQHRHQAVFTVELQDGSVFRLPARWERVFYVKFGNNPQRLRELEERLRFVTSKYYEHRAWPSKFDGLFFDDPPEGCDPDNFSRYDYDQYYGENWGERAATALESNPPTMAQVAEAAMYQSLRILLMRQAFKDLGSDVQVLTLDDLASERYLPEP
jgi:hypothetical protein